MPKNCKFIYLISMSLKNKYLGVFIINVYMKIFIGVKG